MSTSLLLASFSLHEWAANMTAPGKCVPPGQCTAPDTKFSKVVRGPVPGQQWNINGGFCGAFSTQHAALAAGAWVSQDLVRKANREQPGEHNMHGDRTEGYEVMPSNVAFTASKLRLAFEEWDYTQPSPQAPAYKKWLKAQLAQGRPIVWFPICKGDGHHCYPGSCPNGGACDHVEAMYGLFSNHELSDPEVYDDDWIVHTSDQDYMPYYRPLNSLEDTVAMEGNCKHAGAGFGKNEMYPCFDSSVTYGLAVKGLNVSGSTLPVSLTTDGAVFEPNVREGSPPKTLTAEGQVSGYSKHQKVTVYRYDGADALPTGPPFAPAASKSFSLGGLFGKYTFKDTFKSNTAVYYVAVPEEEKTVEDERAAQ